MDISVSLFQIVMGLAVYLVIAAVLIAVSVIDFRTRRIPNEYVLALLALRLVVAAMLCGEAPPRRLCHLPLQVSFR